VSAARDPLGRANDEPEPAAGPVEADATQEAAEQALAAVAPASEADDVYSEWEEGQVAERLASLGYLE
jgi:hypothetical protein